MSRVLQQIDCNARNTHSIMIRQLNPLMIQKKKAISVVVEENESVTSKFNDIIKIEEGSPDLLMPLKQDRKSLTQNSYANRDVLDEDDIVSEYSPQTAMIIKKLSYSTITPKSGVSSTRGSLVFSSLLSSAKSHKSPDIERRSNNSHKRAQANKENDPLAITSKGSLIRRRLKRVSFETSRQEDRQCLDSNSPIGALGGVITEFEVPKEAQLDLHNSVPFIERDPVVFEKVHESSLFKYNKLLASLTLLAFVIAFIVCQLQGATYKIQLCNSESAQKDACLECPRDAICSEGLLECLPGFVQYKDTCIEDSIYAKNAHEYLKFTSELLAKLKGDKSCNYVSEDAITLTEIKRILNVRYGTDPNFKGSISTLIKYISEEPLVLGQYNIVKNAGRFQEINLTSLIKIRTLQCKIYTHLADNMLKLVLLFIFGLIAAGKLSGYLSDRNSKNLAKIMYDDILARLQKTRCMCTSRITQDLGEKYGDELVKQVWPMIEEIRKKERSVLVYQEEYRTRYLTFWKI